MISDLQLLLALRVSLTRVVTSGDWPAATQGEDAITHSLLGVDLTVWNDAYIAKIPVATGATVTVDLRNFTSLLFEAAVALDTVFGLAAQCNASTPVGSGIPDSTIVIRPGATNGADLFFEGATGVGLRDGDTLMHIADPTDAVGWLLDATHKTLDLENVGTHDGVLTLIVIGGN